MGNSYLDMAEEFLRMSESLLRLVKATRRTQAALDHILWQQYQAAGEPFGDSEEGLAIWKDTIHAALCTDSGNSEIPHSPNCEDSSCPAGHFILLSEEIRKRIN